MALRAITIHWHRLHIGILYSDARLYLIRLCTCSFVVLKLLSNLIWKIQLWLFSALYLVRCKTAFAFTPYRSCTKGRPIISSRYIYMYTLYRRMYKLNGKLTKRCATLLTLLYTLLFVVRMECTYYTFKIPTTLQSVYMRTRNSIQYIKYDGTSVRIPLLSTSLLSTKS